MSPSLKVVLPVAGVMIAVSAQAQLLPTWETHVVLSQQDLDMIHNAMTIRSMASLQEPLLPGATRLREIRGPSSWAKNSLGKTSNARTSSIQCAQAARRFIPSIIISSAVYSRMEPGKSRDFGWPGALAWTQH